MISSTRAVQQPEAQGFSPEYPASQELGHLQENAALSYRSAGEFQPWKQVGTRELLTRVTSPLIVRVNGRAKRRCAFAAEGEGSLAGVLALRLYEAWGAT